MKRVKAVAFALALGLTFVSLASTANAATLYVRCNASPYLTIQSAVNAANSGDTIIVCPYVYTENVSVPSTLTSLTIQAKGAAKLTPGSSIESRII